MVRVLAIFILINSLFFASASNNLANLNSTDCSVSEVGSGKCIQASLCSSKGGKSYNGYVHVIFINLFILLNLTKIFSK